MTDFLQLFFSGLATGSIYALAALGFTLLWQASGTINFAQGEFVMLPAFATPPLTKKIDGWLPVKKLAVNDMTISGKISMGLLDSSSFTIDRISGIITSSGGFTGKCAAIAAENRQF